MSFRGSSIGCRDHDPWGQHLIYAPHAFLDVVLWPRVSPDWRVYLIWFLTAFLRSISLLRCLISSLLTPRSSLSLHAAKPNEEEMAKTTAIKSFNMGLFVIKSVFVSHIPLLIGSAAWSKRVAEACGSTARPSRTCAENWI